MPAVVISFVDGEVLHAEIPELTFDMPVIEAEVRGVEPNNQRAILPLTAITQIIMGSPGPPPPEDVVAGWDRAAFHFIDGQVLRAAIEPGTTDSTVAAWSAANVSPIVSGAGQA